VAQIWTSRNRSRHPQGSARAHPRHTEGALGVWLFSTGLRDLSARGNHGTGYSVTLTGKGADFAAADSGIYLPTGSLDASTQVTAVVHALARSSGGGSVGRLLDTGTSQGVGYLLSRYTAADNALVGGSADFEIPTSPALVFGRFQTILFTQAGTLRQIWVDGTLVSSISGYGGLASSAAVLPAIGNRSDGWNDRAFDGVIASAYVLPRGASPAEAKERSRNYWMALADERVPVFYSLGGGSAALVGDGAAGAVGAGALSTSIRLVGAAVAGAAGAGSLSTAINLAGASATVSATGTGALTATIRLSGAAVAAALAAGGLTTGIPLAGAGTGGAAGTGALTAGSGLAGAGQVATAGAGAITTSITLSGAALAAALGSGSLTTTPAGLAGGAVAGGQGAGSLTTGIPLAGAAAASVVGAGGLVTAIPLAGAATAAVSATGDLVVSFGLSGAALVSAIGGGALLTSISLSGAAVARAVGSGMLTGAAIHASSWRTRDASARVRSLRASARVRRALAGTA